MTSVTLRPDTIVQTSGTPNGAANNLLCVQDDSDLSFVYFSSFHGTTELRVSFAPFTLPAGAVITDFTVTARWLGLVEEQYSDSTVEFAECSMAVLPNGTGTRQTIIGARDLIQDKIFDVDIVGDTITDINNYIYIIGRKASLIFDLKLYSLSATLTYNEMPVVAIQTPAVSDLIISTNPKIAWTFTDPEGSTQNKFQVKVFTAAQYGAGGFNPETSAAYWSTSVRTSTDLSIQTSGFADGTYRVYVKAADYSDLFSAWTFREFVVAVSSPNAPVISSSSTNLFNATTTLSWRGRDNMLRHEVSSLEDATAGFLFDPANNVNCTTNIAAPGSHGRYSLHLVSAAAGTMSMSTVQGSGGIIAVSQGEYSAVASFRAATVGRSCQVIIEWLNESNGIVSTTNGTVVVSTTGGWVQSVATGTIPGGAFRARLRVSVAGTAAASETHYVDKMGFFPGASPIWNFGGFPFSGLFEIQRSIDQINWVTIRPANGVTNVLYNNTLQLVTVVDYEAPFNKTLYYRARSVGYVESASNGPTYGIFSATVIVPAIPISDWWLKDVGVPANNSVFGVLDRHTITIKSQQTAYYALGRKFPIVVSDVTNGEDGVVTYDIQTLAEYEKIKVLLKSTNVLLLQSPYGEQWYIRIMGDRSLTTENTAVTAPYRSGSIEYVEVDSGV